MAAPVYVSQSDLEAVFGARMVRQVFVDDGSTTPGPRLTMACSVASRQADALLLAAWGADAIVELVDNDDAIKSSICKLALAEGMEGRPEWSTSGSEDSQSEKLRKAARQTLKDLASAQLRSAGEAEAGQNPHLSVGRVSTARSPHEFVFAPSRYKPTRGGF